MPDALQLNHGGHYHTLAGVTTPPPSFFFLKGFPLLSVILVVYVDSYLFVISASILQVGVGVNSNQKACACIPKVLKRINFVRAGIFICIFFYCSSKVSLSPRITIIKNICRLLSTSFSSKGFGLFETQHNRV